MSDLRPLKLHQFKAILIWWHCPFNIGAIKNNYFEIEIKFSWKDFKTESSHVLWFDSALSHWHQHYLRQCWILRKFCNQVTRCRTMLMLNQCCLWQRWCLYVLFRISTEIQKNIWIVLASKLGSQAVSWQKRPKNLTILFLKVPMNEAGLPTYQCFGSASVFCESGSGSYLKTKCGSGFGSGSGFVPWQNRINICKDTCIKI